MTEEKEVEKLGIKESMEILDGVKAFAIASAKVAKDGKISVADLTILVDLAKDFDKMKTGWVGADVAVKEMKDLDEMEVVALIAKMFEIVKAVKNVKEEA